MNIHPFLKRLNEKVLVFDGALGTNLQKLGLTPSDFNGKDGCNEYLVITKPDAVRSVHESFLQAGCDVIETNSFGCNRIVLAEYGLENKVVELNEKAARLAKEVANKYSTPDHPRFVMGSVGPGTKLPSLGHIGFAELKKAYKVQFQGLIAGGVDGLLIETCQDLLQTKIAIIAAEEYFAQMGRRLPLMAQVTFESTGTMLLGTDVNAVIATLEMFPVDVIGLNCATGPAEMADHVRAFCENSIKPISVLPNAGLPENIGGVAHYHLTPQELADFHERFVKEFGVSIVGGCCGTTPEHLKAVVERVGTCVPKKRTPKHDPGCASLYGVMSYTQKPAPLLIGEQTNANGSKKFKQLLERDDYDAITEMARDAVKEGAHLVDLCVAFVGRDEKKDMIETVKRFNQQVTVPLMIDSTEPQVIEEALKHIAGKAIINSINLEDGGQRLRKICGFAKKYGAGLVALVIDEKGMAKMKDEKLRIARRIHEIVTKEFGIRSEDLFFDMLTFTLGSGSEEFRNAAVDTLAAIRELKREFPEVHTVLGVSNISFGLAPHARQVLNSVFLNDAVAAGLDAAIVHAKKIIPLFKIGEDDLDIAKKLLYNQWTDGKDPLQRFIAHFEQKNPAPLRQEVSQPSGTIEETLKNHILNGSAENLEAHLDEAKEKYPPLEIINNFLLGGMKVVGELFGSGKMQLPFVLQSAEVMKKAVNYLERFMEKEGGQERGRIVLATVKGDVHDIGKNLVDIILTNNGYKVINLGIKQPIDAILKSALESKADAIGLSGLLVKSTLIMRENLEEMNQRGMKLPVICGGAALTERYVEKDLAQTYRGPVYYGRDAFSALKIMEKIKTGTARPEENLVPAAKPESAVPVAAGASSSSASREDLRRKASRGPSFHIHRDNPIPKVPFLGYRILKNIPLPEVFKWVNKTALYRMQWQFKQGERTSREFELYLQENVEPIFERFTTKAIREKWLEPKVIYGYYRCYSENNDLVVVDAAGNQELVRFTFPRQRREPFECISDFFRPKGSTELDVAGFHIVTMGKRAAEMEKKLFEENKYIEYLYLHGLSVEAAEALAEYTHALIRRDMGIHGQDRRSKEELFRQGYQGSRYSFGYPACPVLEDQKKLFLLLPGEKIGVHLSETFQMIPEQSTSAIIAHHHQAKYFSV
ncbi:MAG TPA: methionine synthase [Candidatus Omnitrophota bacterium]|nr:methionine synthase [Candidatus Omnitrophota bacterium]